jgi:hypothetical protein
MVSVYTYTAPFLITEVDVWDSADRINKFVYSNDGLLSHYTDVG